MRTALGLRDPAQLLAAAATLPLVAGFVLLGAGVLMGRALLDSARAMLWRELGAGRGAVD